MEGGFGLAAGGMDNARHTGALPPVIRSRFHGSRVIDPKAQQDDKGDLRSSLKWQPLQRCEQVRSTREPVLDLIDTYLTV